MRPYIFLERSVRNTLKPPSLAMIFTLKSEFTTEWSPHLDPANAWI
jgi:hypothetical protein